MKKIIFLFLTFFLLSATAITSFAGGWGTGGYEGTGGVDVRYEDKMKKSKEKLERRIKLEEKCAKDGANSAACSELELLKLENKGMTMDPSFVKKFNDDFMAQITKWVDPITNAAKYLLFSLATIALCVRLIPLVLKGAELGEILKELIIFILVIGIWLAFLLNAREWTDAIIDSFTKLAQQANGSVESASPQAVLTQGFIVAGKVISVSTGPFSFLGYLACAIILIFIYAKIAFYLLKVFLETLIISYGGIILLGFAGFDFTSDYAKRYFTYVISCGIKLFIALLIIGFGTNFIADYTLNYEMNALGNCLGIITVVLMLMFLSEQVPDMAQSMVSGASLGGGSLNIGGTIAAMAAFTAAISAAAVAFKGAAFAANTASGATSGAATGGATPVSALAQSTGSSASSGAATLRASVNSSARSRSGGIPSGARPSSASKSSQTQSTAQNKSGSGKEAGNTSQESLVQLAKQAQATMQRQNAANAGKLVQGGSQGGAQKSNTLNLGAGLRAATGSLGKSLAEATYRKATGQHGAFSHHVLRSSINQMTSRKTK